jgi:hypothetical protein
LPRLLRRNLFDGDTAVLDADWYLSTMAGTLSTITPTPFDWCSYRFDDAVYPVSRA